MGKFWETPELVEKLLPYLDLSTTKLLAESHKLTRKILKKAFNWNKLIQRILPLEDRVPFLVDWSFGSPFPSEDDPLLASEKQKAKILAQILTLINGDSAAELVLFHAICERNPISSSATVIDVTFMPSCLQTHRVSPWGLMLLKEVEASLGSRQQGLLEVDTVKMIILGGPLLMALTSKVASQQRMMKKLDVDVLVCDSQARRVPRQL